MQIQAEEKNKFGKRLFSLVLPIAFQNFMTALVGVSDTLMLGRLKQDMLSGASLAGQLSFVFSLFTTVTGLGFGTLAAQYYGKKDNDAIEQLFAFVMSVSAAGSMLFFVIALFLPVQWMCFFTNDTVIIKAGAEYLKTVAPMFLMSGISSVYQCLLRCCLKATQGSLISVTGVILNIILNAVFIFGLAGMPALGIRGAALATDIAKAAELILCIMVLPDTGIRLRFKQLFHPVGSLDSDFIRIALPVAGNEFAWGLGVTMYSTIMGRLGADAVAANAVVTTIRYLTICLCIGIGSGGSVMVGNELGAGNILCAREYGDRLCKLSIVFGVVAGFANLLVIPAAGLFSTLSNTAYGYMKKMLLISLPGTIGKSVNSTTIGGLFASGGDTSFGLICDVITIWCVILPGASLAAFWFKAPATLVYGILSMDEVIKLPAVYIHYRKYRWLKNLTSKFDEKEAQNE